MPISNKPRKVKSRFNGNTPKAPTVGDHSRGDGWYHPRKGWRKVRKPSQHSLLIRMLLPFGIAPIQ